MVKEYIPDRGDLVWITLNPHSGHEQSGRRPAVVISPALYNSKVGLSIMCPVTGQVKGYPFEVKIPAGLEVKGVVLADQVRNLDWRARKAELICSLPEDAMTEIQQKLIALITG